MKEISYSLWSRIDPQAKFINEEGLRVVVAPLIEYKKDARIVSY